MPPVCIPPTDACKRPKLVQNVEDWHIAARHCPARHMPHHQATQLLAGTAALRCLQIIHQREDARIPWLLWRLPPSASAAASRPTRAARQVTRTTWSRSAGRLPWPHREEAPSRSRRGVGWCRPRSWQQQHAPRQPWLNARPLPASRGRRLPRVADAMRRGAVQQCATGGLFYVRTAVLIVF